MPTRKTKPSFSASALAWELHDLLGIPRSVFRSKSGHRYERPVAGQRIIKAIIKVLVDALRRHDRVYIRDFGEFRVIERAWKTTPPRPIIHSEGPGKITRSPIPLPARRRYRIKFTPSLTLRAIAKIDKPETLTQEEQNTVRRWHAHR